MATHDLSAFLEEYVGAGSAEVSEDVLRCMSASGALLSPVERAKQKMLQALGDAELTLWLASQCFAMGVSVENYQQVRSSMLSNASLAGYFTRSRCAACVLFPVGVDTTTRVGASAYECVVGGLLTASPRAVRRFLVVTGLEDAVVQRLVSVGGVYESAYTAEL